MLGIAGTASAAVITPVNMDPAGSGLNDTTAAAPVGGNPGTTVGEQRRLVYQLAAELWGTILVSDVEIKVEASFANLTCSANSAVLGSAGARTAHAEFGAGVPATWYGAALANSLAGEDLSPAQNDIASRFNANLGKPDCLSGSGWYYGFDGNTPAGQISFLDVVMHEIGHGLNFSGFYNLTTGAPFGTAPNNFPDVYSRNVFDNASGMAWTAMTNAQRVTAAKGGNLVWTGANVTAEAPYELTAQAYLVAYSNRLKPMPMVTAAYGPLATPDNFEPGRLVYGLDPTGGTHLGCQAFPAGSFTGKTVLLDRGSCSFKTKTLNAQNAGAAKVIIANNVASGYPGMGDDAAVTATISIPSIGITQANGLALRKQMGVGLSVALEGSTTELAGSDTAGRVRLYAPATLATGSTFSHFDVSLTPNALMEPFINDDLDAATSVDLTTELFQDLGWTLAP
jgi:hypothetical protein